MLTLKLTPSVQVSSDALTNGKVELELGATKLNGVFQLVSNINSTDAALTLAGKIDAPVKLTSASDVKATLKADLTHKVVLAGGVEEIKTGIKADAVTVKSAPAGVTAAVAEGEIVLTCADTVKAGNGEVVFEQLTVATGEGVDPHCVCEFTIKAVGLVHCDALCNWSRCAGLRPNREHFCIHAVDEHTKIRTFEDA